MNTQTKKWISSTVALSLLSPSFALAQQAAVNSVPLPKLNWTELRDISTQGNYSADGKLLKSEKNKLAGRESEVAISNKSSSSYEATALNPSPAPYVIGTFNPYDATLRVDVLRLEKLNGRTKIFTANIDPSFGNYYRAARTYADPSNPADSVNPFEQYAGNGTLFNGISMAASGVVISHVSQLLKAPVAMIGVPRYRGNYFQERQGRWYGKKLIHHYQTYSAMDWYMGAATVIAPLGAEASICAEPVEEGEPCPEHRRVPSFLRFTEYKGGNVPTQEVLLEDRREVKRDYRTLIMIGAMAAIMLAPVFIPPEMIAAGAAGNAGAAAAANVYGGCAFACSVAAAEWNDNQVDKFQAEGYAAQREMNNPPPTDSSLAMGVVTPIASSEGLTFKQQNSPLFVSKRSAVSPGDSKLQQYGFQAIRARASSDPFRGGGLPHTVNMISLIMPEAFIERKLALDNLQITNNGDPYTSNSNFQSRAGGTQSTSSNPQTVGTGGVREAMK